MIWLAALGMASSDAGTLTAAGAEPHVSCANDPPDSCVCEGSPIGHATYTPPAWFLPPSKSVYKTSARMNGVTVPLSDYRARAAILVNVASAWGFANVNYGGFRSLLGNYSAHGFQVLAFPCNQFGAQAPASDDCERSYMHKKVGTSDFPVFDKVDVNGPNALDAFKVAKSFSPGAAPFEIAWNYEKFLLDAEGVPVARYPTDADPTVAEPEIRKLLGLS